MVVVFYGLLLASGCQKECPEYEECPECKVNICEECQTCEECKEPPKEKALMDIKVRGWIIDISADYRMFFDVSLINYGYVEAENVIVVCNFKNENNKILTTITKEVGNMLPLTVTYKKLSAVTPLELKKQGKDYCDFELECKITKCNNCEILSKKMIPMNRYPAIGYI